MTPNDEYERHKTEEIMETETLEANSSYSD